MSNFIARNKPAWSELERLVDLARKSHGRITPEEIGRLDLLYRRTAVHLAQATTRTSDAGLIQYLNGLTAAAHSVIYLPPKRPAFKGVVGFVARHPNLYITAMHSGITLSPLIGQVAAMEILDGVAVDLLKPFRPARFA